MKKQEKPVLVGTTYAELKNQTTSEAKALKRVAEELMRQAENLVRRGKLTPAEAEELVRVVFGLNSSAHLALEHLSRAGDKGEEEHLLKISGAMHREMQSVHTLLDAFLETRGKKPMQSKMRRRGMVS